jgi:hypothetical protein
MNMERIMHSNLTLVDDGKKAEASALPGFEARICLVDDVNATPAPY